MLLYKWPREAHYLEGQEGIHAPNRAIDMHTKAAYMHPKVSIDLHPTTAYFAPNRAIDMRPKGMDFALKSSRIHAPNS